MPERKRDPIHDQFFTHFNELENDMLNIQQILKHRKKSGASFDTIAHELESLKDDGLNRLVEMHRIFHGNTSHFPANTNELLVNCQRLLNNVHPEFLTQERWAFKEKWLNEFKRNLGY